MMNKILPLLLLMTAASSAQAMYDFSRQDRVSCRDAEGNVRIVLKYDTKVDVEIPVSIIFDGEKAIARNTLRLEQGEATLAGATETDAKFVMKAYRHHRSYKTDAYLDGEWTELKCATSTKFGVK